MTWFERVQVVCAIASVYGAITYQIRKREDLFNGAEAWVLASAAALVISAALIAIGGGLFLVVYWVATGSTP